MLFLKQLFTWWNGQTLNTRFYTWRKGSYVGADQFGNKYYRAKSAVPRSISERRWVVYNGYSEASTIPPGWHGWMHHRTDVPPTEEDYTPREWQKPFVPNQTGTPNAYRPKGSILSGARPAPSAPDYSAWRPE
ncbi:NADH:ubiquinone oxidoreductase subunit NDUFA12 [Aestuariivirga sp.]|uniref:NADH:ubiquinone oxidoreductase subunit NDUFA12 n=1 Tax=Aestuariivirga sp. TaxID=2650926 RepID=UPI0025BD48CF|nr:NADH:ubiquinone oxidoreductase subunit NDUFA12 [Aestuariivirga sp.]MCA3555166.1 NADH:ubiquinone oxidoreductase subunit NDUFA12 [Aestuariivirga sp.]